MPGSEVEEENAAGTGKVRNTDYIKKYVTLVPCLQQLKKFSLTLRNAAVALLKQNSAFLLLMTSLTRCKVLCENFSLQRRMIRRAVGDIIMHEYWEEGSDPSLYMHKWNAHSLNTVAPVRERAH